jgi:hypothetical protein
MGLMAATSLISLPNMSYPSVSSHIIQDLLQSQSLNSTLI